MRSAVFASATFHAVVVAVVYFGLPKWFEPEEIEETPIIVELVDIAETTVAAPMTPVVEAPKAEVPPAPAPQPVAAATPPPPPPAPEPPPPPPAEPPPAEAAPAQQVAALEPPPTPVARPTPPPPPAPTVQAPPKPQAKPTPPKVVATPKPKTKPEPPKQQVFDPTAIAALLDRTRQPVAPPTPTPPQVQPKQAAPTPPHPQAAPAPVMSPTPQPARDVPLAISELDAFRAAVERCWSIPAGARDAQNLRVTLRLFLTQEGTLLRAPEVVDGARMNRAGEETFRAAAESALRAVQRCAPYRMLPAQKYDTWREIELTFDPSKVLAG